MSQIDTSGRLRLGEVLFGVGVRRQPRGLLGAAIRWYSAAVALWVVYSVTMAILHPWFIAAIFLCAIYGVIFLVVGASQQSSAERPSWIDWVLSAVAVAAGVYFAVNATTIVNRIPQLDELSDLGLAVGTAIFLLTLEATRRTTGLGLTLVVLVFVAYNLLGHRLGGVISHGYISFIDFIEIVIFTTNGIMGAPIRVAATYAFMFVLFGTFLSRTGGGDFFYNLAAAISGRKTGGPAKIAVVSSGLYGTLSGSSVADVVTTGSITIPMMKRLGYPSVFAAATEVSASTGGSLMPPVMGAAAFIMVEYTGVSYPEIALSALIPALLYYLAIYSHVHLRSQRLGLVGLSPDRIPKLADTFREGWLLLVPLGVIVVALAEEFSPTFVALYGTLAVLAVAVLRWRRSRMTVAAIVDGLADTTWRILPAAGACAAAGLVIAGLTLTGLSQKFAHLVYAITGASMLPTLLVAALLTLILGLGMPAVSAYILSVVLIGPTLTGLGVPLLAAHMFVLYFAVLSAMTPPVAVAAYAASAISGDNPIHIAAAAVRLSIAAFIVPFAFVYGPELLLVGDPLGIVVACLTAVVGVVALAIAAEGHFRGPISPGLRLAIAVAALCLIYPSYYAALIGGTIFLAGLSWRWASQKRAQAGAREFVGRHR